MKFCLYQGTFNPIHNAHIEVGKYVYENFDFDKIIFIPAFKPPHKNNGEDDITLAKHRLEMVKLAIKPYPCFELSDIEYKKTTPSFTYLTILELIKKYNIKDKISFIIGTDAFLEIESWYKSDELKKLVKFIVFARDNNINNAKLEDLKEKGYEYIIAKMPFLDISSSEIRQKINQNIDIYDIVPKEAADYIIKNGLYRH